MYIDIFKYKWISLFAYNLVLPFIRCLSIDNLLIHRNIVQALLVQRYSYHYMSTIIDILLSKIVTEYMSARFDINILYKLLTIRNKYRSAF